MGKFRDPLQWCNIDHGDHHHNRSALRADRAAHGDLAALGTPWI